MEGNKYNLKRKMYLRLSMILLLSLSIYKPLFAQSDSNNYRGSIKVTNKDYNGNKIIDYWVKAIKGTDTLVQSSDTNGVVVFSDIPLGDYAIQLEFKNGQTKRISYLEVNKGMMTSFKNRQIYPCPYFDRKKCIVNNKSKHKILPVEHINYFGQDSIYINVGKRRVKYFNKANRNDCFPNFYCKSHCVFFY